MSVSIIDRSGVLNSRQREEAERRLLFALSRFHPKIKRVSLVLADVAGQRGGVETWCRIAVRLRRGPDVAISDQDVDVARCISRVTDRAGRAVGRAIERSRYAARSGIGRMRRPAAV
jgi:hypothetical protein